ncbi:TetR/AcrR family transcriptional regulator [Clostridia bacterium OttesenSCG-928-F22]|nr:TetR/AcrR family transcriptional regulator [Clostridia bacterium OttesenSCG-928-F22]
MNNSFKNEVRMLMADLRLEKVYKAASKLFIEKGFSGTQVAEIAREANVATGTMYNLFASKKAIFCFVLHGATDEAFLQQEIELPYQDEDISFAEKMMDKSEEGIQNALDTERYPPESFEMMLQQFYDAMKKWSDAIHLLERNFTLFPGMRQKYYGVKGRMFAKLTANMKQFTAKGDIRKVEYPELHAQNIIETLAWWAMHIKVWMPHIPVPDEKAKEIAIDNVMRMYLKRYDV